MGFFEDLGTFFRNFGTFFGILGDFSWDFGTILGLFATLGLLLVLFKNFVKDLLEFLPLGNQVIPLQVGLRSVITLIDPKNLTTVLH